MIRSTRSSAVRTSALRFAGAALAALTLSAAFGAHPSLAAAINNPDGSKVDAFDSMALLLPTSALQGNASVALTAARNEYESFQVKVSAGGAALTNVSVSLGAALTGPNGATIPAANVRFAREDYYRLTTMSDGELATEFPRDAAGTCQGDCRIPDALIPERDLLTNEDRAAFPMTVPTNENRVAWVDVLVPTSAATGTYSGTVLVKAGAATLSTIPVTLEVLNATLPSTSTMKSQVFVNANDVGGSWSTYQQLAELGLANHLSVVPDGFDPAAGASVLGPLLNGTDNKVPLAGARLTQIPITRWGDFAKWKQVLTGLGKADAARFWCDEVDTATCSSWFTPALATYPGLKLQQIPRYQKATTDADYLDARSQAAVPIVTGLDPKAGWFQQWQGVLGLHGLYAGWVHRPLPGSRPLQRHAWMGYRPAHLAGPGHGLERLSPRSRR